jgi:hypothetical protein
MIYEVYRNEDGARLILNSNPRSATAGLSTRWAATSDLAGGLQKSARGSTNPQRLDGVFLWNLELEAIDLEWVESCSTVSQPEKGCAFYFEDASFAAGKDLALFTMLLLHGYYRLGGGG